MPEAEVVTIKVFGGSNGRCVSCGYLARRALFPKLRESLHSEMSLDSREAGGGNSPIDLFAGSFGLHIPDCYVKKQDLFAEIHALVPITRSNNNKLFYEEGTSQADAAKRVFIADRNCDGWSQYYPGFSPKEHLEMYRFDLLRQAQQDYEKNTERNRRRWELALLRRTEKRDASRFFMNIAIGAAALIFTFIQVWYVIFPAESAIEKMLKTLIERP